MNGKIFNGLFVLVIVVAAGLFAYVILDEKEEPLDEPVQEKRTEVVKRDDAPVVVEVEKEEVVEVAPVVVQKVKKQTQVEQAVEVVAEEVMVDPDAERRERFETQIANWIDLARGDDMFALMETILEPGTEFYEQIQVMRDNMDNVPVEHRARFQENIRRGMDVLADSLESLSWDELTWANDEVQVEMTMENQTETMSLYEKEGTWYLRPPSPDRR